MKEIARKLENTLVAAFRRHDCPAPDVLRDILLGKIKSADAVPTFEHVRNCSYCQSEVRALAQISGIAIEAALLGYEPKELAQIEERVRRVIKVVVPHELAAFSCHWQLALVHETESDEAMPLAAAAFSGAGRSRAVRIIRAALLLGTRADVNHLGIVAKKLHLTPKEHAALAAEFIN